MPDIDSMTIDSDFTGFLSPGVSDGLRKAALRKLFRSEVFNVCDGLDDYDEDYTTFKNLGAIFTADMRHQVELKAQRAAEKILLQKQQVSGYDDSANGQDTAATDGATGRADHDAAVALADTSKPQHLLSAADDAAGEVEEDRASVTKADSEDCNCETKNTL
jgi:hypothetical protein